MMSPADSDFLAQLSRVRLPMSSEGAAQRRLDQWLKDAGHKFSREHRLSSEDIIDFLLEDGTGIELKIKGQATMPIYLQLERYAEHPEVRRLILLTGRAIGMPEEIKNKPVVVISMGAAWL